MSSNLHGKYKDLQVNELLLYKNNQMSNGYLGNVFRVSELELGNESGENEYKKVSSKIALRVYSPESQREIEKIRLPGPITVSKNKKNRGSNMEFYIGDAVKDYLKSNDFSDNLIDSMLSELS